MKEFYKLKLLSLFFNKIKIKELNDKNRIKVF